MAARRDTQYLQKHGTQWRVRLKVPERLRSIIGKAHLVRPLHTDSLAVANREKLKHVIALREEMEKAEVVARQRARRPGDPMIEEALTWRQAIQDDETEDKVALHALEERVDEIERREGEYRATEFAQLATGSATPISSMVDTWLAEKPMKPRQKLDYRRAVLKFEAWLKENRLPPTLEGTTRKIAGRYVSENFVKHGAHWRTTNKDVSCLSSYWKWLEKKDFVSEIIWRGQSLPKERVPNAKKKRHFTDAEITTLFTGGAKPFLMDAMMIAALSGMRVDEIARIKIGDIADRCIEVKEAKTKAGERLIPIHPALAEIIARRSTYKEKEDFLFDELPTPREDSANERSQPIVKAFIYYRRGLKVDDRPPGARQSRIDFHSFRRTFATKARDALLKGAVGYSPWTLAEVMGHGREFMELGMTMARYAGDETMDAKRACVEAVLLPPFK